jgi:hypothetical protein
MPIVTLSKSMSRAALGACWNGDAVYGDAATEDIACGPR